VNISTIKRGRNRGIKGGRNRGGRNRGIVGGRDRGIRETEEQREGGIEEGRNRRRKE